MKARTKYLFTNEVKARQAEARLRELHGMPIVGRNAATGKPAPDKTQTVRWSEPLQRDLDGKWEMEASPIVEKSDQQELDRFKADFPHEREEPKPVRAGQVPQPKRSA